jgi:hypothetical protein
VKPAPLFAGEMSLTSRLIGGLGMHYSPGCNRQLPVFRGLHPEESSGVHHTLMGIIMSGIVVFFFINLSLLKLRKLMPDARWSFKVPSYSYTPIFAMIGCIILARYLNANAVLLISSF